MFINIGIVVENRTSFFNFYFLIKPNLHRSFWLNSLIFINFLLLNSLRLILQNFFFAYIGHVKYITYKYIKFYYKQDENKKIILEGFLIFLHESCLR